MKFIKIAASIVVGLLLLVFVAAGIFLVTFDANDYRTDISQQVEKATGRQLVLGDIKPSVFPWLGIELQDIALSNAPGFVEKNMLSAQRLDLSIALLPLLKQEIHIDTLRLHGLNLSLGKNAQGKTNWDDILQRLEKNSKTAASSQSVAPQVQTESNQTQNAAEPQEALPLSALLINGIEVKDADIHWQDASTKQDVHLTKFNLMTGALKQGAALPIELDTLLALKQPQANAHIKLQTRIDIDLQQQQFNMQALQLKIDSAMTEAGIQKAQLSIVTPVKADLLKQHFVLPNLVIDVAASGESFPGGEMAAKLTSSIDIDLSKQTADLNALSLQLLGITINSQLSVKQLQASPRVSGRLTMEEFNPRDMSKKLAIDLPTMQGKQSLTKLLLSFDFEGDDKKLSLDKLLVKLDQSTLLGNLNVMQFDKPAIRYDLQMDTINLDNYLPPTPAQQTSETVGASTSVAPVPDKNADVPIALPIPLLRSLDVAGTFKIKDIQGFKLKAEQLLIKTQAKNGLVKLPTIKVNVLKGDIDAAAELDVRKDTPLYGINLQANNIQADEIVNPVLQEISGEKSVRLTGATQLVLKLDTKGQSLNQLTAQSNGQLSLDMEASTLHGVDIEYFARKAVVSYLKEKKLDAPAEWQGEYKPKETTALKRAHASAKIRNGVVDNRDLILESSRFKVTGAGTINLPQKTLQYRTVTDIAPTRSKTVAERLLDIPMPVWIKGPFAQPDISIDSKVWLKSVKKELKAEAKKQVKQKVKAEKKKQKKKLEKKLDKKVDKLKDKYKDKLKGLFK